MISSDLQHHINGKHSQHHDLNKGSNVVVLPYSIYVVIHLVV